MSTPFTTRHPLTETTVVPATDRQISLGLVTMLKDRNWQDSGATKAIERCAVLNLVIAWSLSPMGDSTPPQISRLINSTVGRNSDIGERVNAILDHLLSVTEPGKEYCHKPLTKDGASKLMDWLQTLPFVSDSRKVETSPSESVADVSDQPVPAGRYALDTRLGAINETAFYKVDRPTEGKWAGYVFVKLLVSDDEQRLSRRDSEVILRRIAEAGPEQAAARYGHEIGRCGMCHATLTNDESRARGIGPICAQKAGW